jgi:hypothetical protein
VKLQYRQRLRPFSAFDGLFITHHSWLKYSGGDHIKKIAPMEPSKTTVPIVSQGETELETQPNLQT